MAEGTGIETVLAAETEGLESEAPLTGADAVALGIAVDAARYDPELSRSANEYLARQRQLVDLQIKHFDEERRLAIAAAKRKRYADRIRNALATVLALGACVVLVGLGVMIYGAIGDHGLVVEAFSVPPDLANMGRTGRVVASNVIDEIDDLQNQSNSARPLATFKNNWGDDIKVDIPETGISIGELSRILHERLGHTTRVEGNIVRTPTGVIVTARTEGHLAVHAAGAESDLDRLVRDVALGIFADTQPYRYALWLRGQPERQADSVAAFRSLAEGGPPEERAWGWFGLGGSEERFQDRLADFRHALQEDPELVSAHMNIARISMYAGLDEDALAAARAGIRANQGAGRTKLNPSTVQLQDLLFGYAVASELGDHQAALKFARTWMTLPRCGRCKDRGKEFEARELILAHDTRNPILSGMPSDIEGTRAGNNELAKLAGDDGLVALNNLLLAAELADWQKVVIDGEALRTVLETEAFPAFVRQQSNRLLYPILAVAYEHLGRHKEADELINDTPSDVYDGWRARAKIALLRQDYSGAEKAIAEAVARAPDLPRAYDDWGEILAAKNDWNGAIAKYAQAHERGPHFSDPLKHWGDALAKQGKNRDALAKYEESLKYAPTWTELNEAHAAVAKLKD